jgi:hypothetical protein
VAGARVWTAPHGAHDRHRADQRVFRLLTVHGERRGLGRQVAIALDVLGLAVVAVA